MDKRNIQQSLQEIDDFSKLVVLANQVVEGFISGRHKSPFHGYSAEFLEHKVYHSGESLKTIDWKLYGKTNKLYSKRFEEETNLRAHIVIDHSSSMYYPLQQQLDLKKLNKIGFAVLASACLMNLLKRQRDAVGLSLFAQDYTFYATEKGGERHHQMLLGALQEALNPPVEATRTRTRTYENLHLIAEKLKRRSLVFLFTDLWQSEESEAQLFDALRHLKYNKHRVVLFHTFDGKKELNFDFDNVPKRFVDVETGAAVNLFAHQYKENYTKAVAAYFQRLQNACTQYRISYVKADTTGDFNKILSAYLVEKQSFA